METLIVIPAFCLNGKEVPTMATTQKRRYTRIEQEEFEQFLNSFAHFEQPEDTTAEEEVYDIPLPADDLVIRIFSTLQDGNGRDCGSDAIRTTVYDKASDTVIGGEKKTLRIETWRSNLRPKVEDLVANWRNYQHGHCPDCGHRLAVRDGKYGEFLGCTDYPNCKHTQDV